MRVAIVSVLCVLGLSWVQQSYAADLKVNELRQIGQAEGWTFDVGSEAYAPRSFGYVPGRFPLGATVQRSLPEESAVALPARWDWREQGIVNPIKDQGQCGSCWAFASASVVESQIKLKMNTSVTIAEQQLVSCDTRFQGCNGGNFASDFYVDTGANYEKDYHYTAKDGSRKTDVPQHEKILKMTVLGADGKEPTVKQIKQAIYEHGPVAAVVAASAPSFSYYTKGVYNNCKDTEIDHMVVLVGWDDKDKAWIMRNSWNTSWGENGYMRIRYTAADGVTKCAQIGSQIGYVELNQ